MIAKKFQWENREYRKLENGIRKLVKTLHFLGVQTIMSCEGHIRTEWYYTGILPWP